MSLQNQLKKQVTNKEASFYVDSSELTKNVAFIKEHKIENLTLISNIDGYNLKDVHFLKELPFIKSLGMGACQQVENYDGLSFLPNLVTLGIAPSKKANVDLSNLLNLRELGFTFTPKIKGFEKLINLESLSVSSGNDEFYNVKIFSTFKKLVTLTLAQATVTNLEFLKQNSKLENLSLSYMKKSFDLEGIQNLKNSLKKLNFTSSKKINHVELISQLTNLESLGFIESVPIQSATLLKPLTKLNAFGTYGSSYFIEGDLRCLKQMKETIKHFKVQDKKHYFYD